MGRGDGDLEALIESESRKSCDPISISVRLGLPEALKLAERQKRGALLRWLRANERELREALRKDRGSLSLSTDLAQMEPFFLGGYSITMGAPRELPPSTAISELIASGRLSELSDPEKMSRAIAMSRLRASKGRLRADEEWICDHLIARAVWDDDDDLACEIFARAMVERCSKDLDSGELARWGRGVFNDFAERRGSLEWGRFTSAEDMSLALGERLDLEVIDSDCADSFSFGVLAFIDSPDAINAEQMRTLVSSQWTLAIAAGMISRYGRSTIIEKLLSASASSSSDLSGFERLPEALTLMIHPGDASIDDRIKNAVSTLESVPF